jgi:hypothetical protein
MEQYELELIAKFGDQDEELNKLWQEHLDFERQLEKYENKRYLTPEEEMEVRNIKKKKLAGKTKIQQILDKYRQEGERNDA